MLSLTGALRGLTRRSLLAQLKANSGTGQREPPRARGLARYFTRTTDSGLAHRIAVLASATTSVQATLEAER